MAKTAITKIYMVHAHPKGEDADLFWMAAGLSIEEALGKLKTKIADSWGYPDEEPCGSMQDMYNDIDKREYAEEWTIHIDEEEIETGA